MIADFKARFPEFDGAVVDVYYPILETVWPSYYGGSYDTDRETVLNLIAHLMVGEIETSTEAVQVEASKSVGSVSVSYAARAASGGKLADFFSTTKYGQRFLMLTAHNNGPRVI